MERQRLFAALVTIAGNTAPLAAWAQKPTDVREPLGKPPNIVLVMTDDMQ